MLILLVWYLILCCIYHNLNFQVSKQVKLYLDRVAHSAQRLVFEGALYQNTNMITSY